MNTEPGWRTALCWGAVVTFLTLPLVVFILALMSHEFEQHIKEFKFLSAYYQSVTALVFGLAGLQSFDRFAATRTQQNGRPVAKES